MQTDGDRAEFKKQNHVCSLGFLRPAAKDAICFSSGSSFLLVAEKQGDLIQNLVQWG